MTVSTRRSGKLKKSITVYTNVPDRDEPIRLTIQGEIWQPVDVKPNSARFGRLRPDAAEGESLAKKLMIINNMEDDANLSDVRSTNPAFQAHTRVIEPGKKFELTVNVLSKLPTGNNRSKILLGTGIKEMPTLSVPVSAYVMSDVDVDPDKLMLAAERPSDLKRQFIVRNNTKRPLKISELKASDPALGVAVQEMRPGTMFRVTVDVPTGYHAPPDGDKITFKTDSPVAPVVTIPITVFHRARRAKAAAARRSPGVRLPSSVQKPKQPPSAAKEGESDAEKKPTAESAKNTKAKPSDG